MGKLRQHGQEMHRRQFLFYLEQRFIKLVVPVLQIVATLRVICYLTLQRISFLESLKIHLISDIKIKLVGSNHFKSSFGMFQDSVWQRKNLP